MTVLVIITVWWLLLAVFVFLLYRAGRAAEMAARWDAERAQAREAMAARESLDRMGEDAGGLWS